MGYAQSFGCRGRRARSQPLVRLLCRVTDRATPNLPARVFVSTSAFYAQLGFTEDWVRTIVHRYIDEGPRGLRDRRRTNPGATPLVSGAVRAELKERLATPPEDGGLWTGPKVALWLSDRLERAISPQRAWEVLRALGFTLQRPRPTAVPADPGGQAGFKKGGLPPPSRT